MFKLHFKGVCAFLNEFAEHATISFEASSLSDFVKVVSSLLSDIMSFTD